MELRKIELITTHGYDAEYNANPFETRIKRICEHSKLRYCGKYSVRDEDDIASFQTDIAMQGARDFALSLIE